MRKIRDQLERLSQNHATLQTTLAVENRFNDMDKEKAQDRRNDYGPLVQTWLKMLAENEQVRELLKS